MKSPLLVALALTSFQWARADASQFFAAPGEYRLSATTSLLVSEDEQIPHFTLKSAVQQNGTATTVAHGGELNGTKPGEPFLLYWDVSAQTLWWATPRRLGYCDVRHPQAARSSSHDRAAPFADHDKFPPRPDVFMAEVDHALPTRP